MIAASFGHGRTHRDVVEGHDLSIARAVDLAQAFGARDRVPVSEAVDPACAAFLSDSHGGQTPERVSEEAGPFTDGHVARAFWRGASLATTLDASRGHRRGTMAPHQQGPWALTLLAAIVCDRDVE